MIGMTVSLLVRPIVRYGDRTAQSDRRGIGCRSLRPLDSGLAQRPFSRSREHFVNGVVGSRAGTGQVEPISFVGAPDGHPLIMRRASRADGHAEHFNPPSNKQ